MKSICIQKQFILWLTFNPGLVLTSYQKTRPWLQQELTIQMKTNTWSAVNFKETWLSMSSKLELTVLSHDTGQQIHVPCFGRCQLTITWMSNIKAVCYKAACLSSFSWSMECGHYLGWLHYHRCSYRFVHMPISNSNSHDNHEKSIHGFPFLS